jgi:hypothetical protein
VLDETVLKVTVLVGPVPVAPEDPPHTGLPTGQATVDGFGMALKVTAVPFSTYSVPVISTKGEPFLILNLF